MAAPVHFLTKRSTTALPRTQVADRAFSLVPSSILVPGVPGASLHHTSAHAPEGFCNTGKSIPPPRSSVFSSIPPTCPVPSCLSIPSSIRSALPSSPARCPRSFPRAEFLAPQLSPTSHASCRPPMRQPSNATRDEASCRGTCTSGQPYQRSHHLDYKVDTEHGGKHLKRVHKPVVIAMTMSAFTPQGQDRMTA